MPSNLVEEIVDVEVSFAGQSFKQSTLSAMFDRIADIRDWKNPIDAVIDAADLLVTQAAVQFYTATELTVEGSPAPGKLRVKAIGYRAGPAGDH